LLGKNFNTSISICTLIHHNKINEDLFFITDLYIFFATKSGDNNHFPLSSLLTLAIFWKLVLVHDGEKVITLHLPLSSIHNDLDRLRTKALDAA
jgi:hypothetical protein